MSAIAAAFLLIAHAAAGEDSQEICNSPYEALSAGCYYFHQQDMNWIQATEYCKSIAGHLIIIKSAEENTAIAELFKGEPAPLTFTGGYSTGHKGEWYWEASRKPIKYNHWGWGQPNNANGYDCACLDTTQNWKTCPCLQSYPFVCESFK